MMAAVKRTKRTKSVTGSFASLSLKQRICFVRALRRIVSACGYAGFNVVGGDANLRGRASIEHGGEDDALPMWDRLRLCNLSRQGMRNSEVMNTVIKQFQINVVGTVGGKAAFVFPDADKSAAMVREAFAKYCRSLEYFDRMSLGEVLKKTLVTYLLGGDMVLYFDAFTDKLVAFEPDCIANVTEADFRRYWPAGWKQVQGRVYDESMQFCGVICSHSQRGKSEFDAYNRTTGKLAVFYLACDPSGDPLDEDWVMVRNAYRFNQGRGTPPVGAAMGSLIDLEDVTKYEIQAAKYNSQTIAQIYQTVADSSAGLLGDGIDPNAAPTNWSEADEAAVQETLAELQDDGEDYSFEEIRGAGVIINKMPASAKMELLDTKHPNANMPEFIRWLAGRSAASMGLGSVYATMKADASYTAFRGEQVMSWPAFEELQKYLESTVCDWVLAHWARRSPIVAAARLPDGWMRHVTWSWPRMREVNQVDEQTALEKKLRNFTGSFHEVYGPNWRERADEIAEEIAYFRAKGIPHPGLLTVSGQQVETANDNGGIQQ